MDEPVFRKRFRIIYADPPWAYRNHTDAANGAACSAMVTMGCDAIKAIPVGDMATDDALLLMWSTNPKLPEALEVMSAWGFDYCTKTTGMKTSESKPLRPRRGIGFWFSGVTEDLLIGRRKKTKRPEGYVGPMGIGFRNDDDDEIGRFLAELQTDGDGLIVSPILKPHSSKPLTLRDWIAETFAGPRAELFARNTHEGFDCFGYDTGWALTPGGPQRLEPAPQPAAPSPDTSLQAAFDLLRGAE